MLYCIGVTELDIDNIAILLGYELKVAGMRFDKLTQLFNIALDMQASHMGLSLADIKEKLCVSHRTSQRIVRGLEIVFPQIEIINDNENKRRWRLPESTIDKLISFNADELSALELSAKMFHAAGRDDEAVLLRSVEQKVQTLMKPAMRLRVDPDLEALLQADGLIVTPGPRREIPIHHVLEIRNAIKAGSVIKVHYNKRDGTERREKLHPYGFLYGHRHYLVARNPARDDNLMRKYRLSDICSIKSTSECFERDKNFNLKEFARQSFGVFNDGMYEVEWLFNVEAAETATDYIFHPNQKSQLNNDGSLTVTFKAGGIQEMAWYLATWGDSVEIIKPKKLKALMAGKNYRWGVLPQSK